MSAQFDTIPTPPWPAARAVRSGAAPGAQRDATRSRDRPVPHSLASASKAPPLRELAMPTQRQSFSVAYDARERALLDPYLAPHPSDADGVLRAWASQFIRGSGVGQARLLPADMARFIHETMLCEAPRDAGAQAPCDTLRMQSGTGRDFAALMFEAIRQLGFAARFVPSEPDDNPGAPAPSALRAVHARRSWLQVYLPREGWAPFDRA